MDSKTANTFSSSNISRFRKQWQRIHGAEKQERNKEKSYLEITGKLLSENILWQKQLQMVGKGKANT